MDIQLIFLGVVMGMSSSLLYHFRLVQFNNFIKNNCPHIWAKHGMGIEGASFLVKYRKLMSLPIEYESDNDELNNKLKTLAWIYKSILAGPLVILTGVFLQLVGIIDA
ncbi:MAG: hypothetical protein IIC60_00820 [Proteobacteria bacterium]|nr:hypothetical protein [Pseudomonadota bacterium]